MFKCLIAVVLLIKALGLFLAELHGVTVTWLVAFNRCVQSLTFGEKRVMELSAVEAVDVLCSRADNASPLIS